MRCRDCIHEGECNGQPFCGGAWYARITDTGDDDETETEQESDDGE